jgi:tRNA(Ile)-lysidine synthase TilS/MesJ
MITQIGEKEALFEFYKDILTYDIDTTGGYESKEVYAKKVSAFFDEISEKVGANKIAIAHNLNDNAETVLMHLLLGRYTMLL